MNLRGTRKKEITSSLRGLFQEINLFFGFRPFFRQTPSLHLLVVFAVSSPLWYCLSLRVTWIAHTLAKTGLKNQKKKSPDDQKKSPKINQKRHIWTPFKKVESWQKKKGLQKHHWIIMRNNFESYEDGRPCFECCACYLQNLGPGVVKLRETHKKEVHSSLLGLFQE
jgi:hypothetical protein